MQQSPLLGLRRALYRWQLAAGWPDAVRGLDDTYVYHLGLIGRERLDAVGDALRAAAAPA
ncbi:hypothetical protein [Clavibacter phaseoli]|uniref:hypothetical protein n=1 Tax=Clavibacter phaseoli TaxID=1734031 RepID=UPI000E672D6F|nr:hypothetical protein [Clavibacter phaseoli]RIJ58420.1 hypothetical protein DZG03_09055 [Clavibacter phaseoli]